MNKEWVETAMRLADNLAIVYREFFKVEDHEEDAAYNRVLDAKRNLEAHLNTPNTNQVDSAKHQSTAAACLTDDRIIYLARTHLERGLCFDRTAHITRATDRELVTLVRAALSETQTRSDSAEAEKQNPPESLGIGREL